MPLFKRDEPSDQPEASDTETETLEWAKNMTPIVSDSTPGTMAPIERANLEADQPAHETTPGAAETAEPAKVEQEPAKLKQEPRVLVVALDENTTEAGQARFFDDIEDASRFIESLIANGLDEGRVFAFRAPPMNLSVSYRPVVAIGQPGEDRPASG